MKNTKLLLSLTASALILAHASQAAHAADDRTAGTIPHAASAAETRSHQIRPINTNLIGLESYGTLNSLKDGSLGVDMWEHSSRSTVLSLIPETPSKQEYAVLHRLLRRALLTQADTSLIHNDVSEEGGQDLLTLRIEKLNDLGDFSGAVALYTANPGDPYHERLARAGVLAMLYNGQKALACMETKALGGKYAVDNPFWTEIAGVCDYLVARMEGQDKSAEGVTTESKVLQQIFKSPRFQYAIKSSEDLSSLTPFEISILIADNRIDYSQLKRLDLNLLSPQIIGLLLSDKNIPEDIRFRILTHAVSRGIKNSEDLNAFYRDSYAAFTKDKKKAPDYDAVEGWRRLAWLYHAATAQKENPPPAEDILHRALALENKYGTTALIPFAKLAETVDPQAFDDESVKTVVKMHIYGENQPPQSWADRWMTGDFSSKKDRFLRLSYVLTYGNTKENTETVEKLTEGLSEAETHIIKILHKKLDRAQKLHNDGPNGVYEKLPDLTLAEGYVTPSIGLMERLDKAVTDRCLGEVILLSSIALQGASPDKIYAGVLGEVLDGFEAVGLTKEARKLSTEIVLGLSR